MGALTDARRFLADALTTAGLECTAYPPDAIAPPVAFVDTLTIDYDSGAGYSFCLSGMCTATVTSCAQRNDKAGATQTLEDFVQPALDALHAIPGVRVSSVQSGQLEIAGTELPTVQYRVMFAIQG